MFFYVFGGEHGETDVGRVHWFPYQIRQNPYRSRICLGNLRPKAKTKEISAPRAQSQKEHTPLEISD